jgi:apolipoprotein N-acyltransferase
MKKNVQTKPASTPTQGAPVAEASGRGHPPRLRPSLGFWREAGQVLVLFALSAAALSWVFPPHGIWPLAFLCLVPWTVAVCRAQRAYLVHWLSFLVGWGFFLVCLRWLMPVTGLGYAALGFYLAIYWPLAAWAIRTGRRHGVGPLWTLPITWVACEFLRGTVMSGFPWLFLAHGLYAQLPLIQISDITGAYGVSFLAALVNGALVELALRRWPVRPAHTSAAGAADRVRARRLAAGSAWPGVVVTALLLLGTLAYGVYRLREVRPDTAAPGPRIAVIQHDFPLVSTPPYGDHPYVVLAQHLALGAQAASEKPDLLVFPETVWSATQNIDFIEKHEVVPEVRPGSWEWGNTCHQAVSAFARGDYRAVNKIIADLEYRLEHAGALRDVFTAALPLPRLPATGPPVTTLVGAVSYEQFPEAKYPKVKQFNSCLMYDRDGAQRRQRYDKNHLVPFGEYVPFRQARFLGFDLHRLYRALNKLSPFSDGGKQEYSLTPGSELTVFTLDTPEGSYRFGTPICYEDTTPYLVRRFVWDGSHRRVDFLVNVSNDGWFLHSNELPQHLAICAFRAVENRVAIARAVNTGISGFIDANGRITSVVADAQGRTFGPGIIGYDLHTVGLDQRGSLYGRFGDWFARLCLLCSAALWLSAVFERWVLAIRHRLVILLRK